MKLFLKLLVTSLAVLIFLFGMNTNVLAKKITCTVVGDHIECSGEVWSLTADEFNDILKLKNWSVGDSWPVNQTEMPGDVDLKKLTITDPGSITVVKAANVTSIFDTSGSPSFTFVSDRGVSSYASVPDASIMWLLGTALMILGFFGRRRAKA